MSFRSDPLPSYEDVISGNFLLKKSTKPAKILTETEDIQQQQQSEVVKVEVNQFKYKTIEREEGELEDGEVSDCGEDGEIKETTKQRGIKTQKPQQKPQPKKQSQKHPQNAQIQKAQKKNEKNGPNFTANTTTSSTSKTAFVPRLICRYFMEGICSKGDKCTFSHAVVPNKTPEEAKVKEPCKFFIAGSCMKGESCYYSNDLSVVPCKFFHLKGECSAVAKGTSCRFSHEPIDKETLEKLKQSEAERIKEKLAAESLINNNITNITNNNIVTSTTTKPEQSQTCKETETSTESPHDVDLLNPFAFAFDDNDDY